MKKSNFTLRNIGSEIAITFNGKPIKKISNFKKALKFVALYITHKNIDNFDLFVWEKNKMERIKDFDPEVMINHSEGKINARKNGHVDFSEFVDEDNDMRDMRDLIDRDRGRGRDRDEFESLMKRYRRDDNDDDFNFENDDFDPREFVERDNFERRPRTTWTYRPADTSKELENIKRNIKSIFNRF